MSQTTKIDSIKDLSVIVDADGHTLEGLDDVLPYVEEEAIKKAIQRSSAPLADVFTYTHTGVLRGESYGRTQGDGLYNADDEAESKLLDLDDFDLDYSVVTPTLHLMIHTVNNDRYATSLAKAYNNWFIDNISDESDRFKLGMVVAPQKPNKAAEEIDRIGDRDDVAGVYLSPGVWKPLGNDYYDPIYQAAQEKDLTIIVHGLQMREGGFPVQAHGAQTFGESHVCSLPFSIMWALTSILLEGVPERYPGLDFVFDEAGISWLPWMKWRMDDHFLEKTDDFPHLKKLPSKYIDEKFYFGTQPIGHTHGNPSQLAEIINIAGPENIMYSADLPHSDFDPPEEVFDRINPYLNNSDVEKIMGGNAVKVFGL